MDAVDRDMKIVRLKRNMADDRRRWPRTIAATPDDGTSRRKSRLYLVAREWWRKRVNGPYKLRFMRIQPVTPT